VLGRAVALLRLTVPRCVCVQMICDDSDLKEMGLPLGPRKKLFSYLQELRHKQVLETCLQSATWLSHDTYCGDLIKWM